MSDLCRFPTLPDSDCEELNTYPWDRPVLKEVVATLLNRPCATLDQLADLTGYSKNDVKTVVLQSPDLIMSIGRIDRKGDLCHRKSLAPFIPPGELWAMVPAAVAKMKLRKMAMVPPKGGRLRRPYVPKKAHVGKKAKRTRRTRVTTSRGFRLWIHDLIHTELTAALLRFATWATPQDWRWMVLHEAVLRQHFGWCHLSKKRAEEIRNGNPLWNMYTDCRGETEKDRKDDNILGPPKVPMDVPDGWVVIKRPVKASSPQAKEGATHEAVGVRVEVEVGGKSEKAYSNLFLQLPPGQTVIYLVPSVILRKRIQTYAKPFPQIQVPDLVIPDPGFRGRPRLATTAPLLVSWHGNDPFPIANNLMRAAQDAVFDLYRNPKPVKTPPEKFKKNPSRETRKSAKRRKRKARKSTRPTPKRPVTASPSPKPRTESGPATKATPLAEPSPKPKLEPETKPAGPVIPPAPGTAPRLHRSPVGPSQKPSPVPTPDPQPEPLARPKPAAPDGVSPPIPTGDTTRQLLPLKPSLELVTMKIQLAPLSIIDSGRIACEFCRMPALPNEECLELQRTPWNRPGLKQIAATLLNLPCATVRQLSGLTGLPTELVKRELIRASQETATTPQLVNSIGGIVLTEKIDPELRPYIRGDEQWAIVPEAADWLRKMAMVPKQMKPLQTAGRFFNRPYRDSLATSGGFLVPIQDLLHAELTSQLARQLTESLGPDQPLLILHAPLLREAFGWSPLSPERADLIRSGQKLWNIPSDMRDRTPPTLFNSDGRRGQPIVPMDVPDAWLVVKMRLTEPYVQVDEESGNETLVTHHAVGIRIQVRTTSEGCEIARRLFEQLPPNQAVLYLSPSRRVSSAFRTMSTSFLQVYAPEISWEPEICDYRIDPSELTYLLKFVTDHADVPFPLSVNLHMAAQDAVYDLYRAPSAKAGAAPRPTKVGIDALDLTRHPSGEDRRQNVPAVAEFPKTSSQSVILPAPASAPLPPVEPAPPPTPSEPAPVPEEPSPFVLPDRIRESPFYAGPDELEDAEQRLRNRLAAGQNPDS